jgi:hypothetical protein
MGFSVACSSSSVRDMTTCGSARAVTRIGEVAVDRAAAHAGARRYRVVVDVGGLDHQGDDRVGHGSRAASFLRSRGMFGVIAMWVEGRQMLEAPTPEMQAEYLSAVTIDNWKAMLAAGAAGGGGIG